MIKITIEHDDEVKTIEGSCAVILMSGVDEEQGRAAVALVGKHGSPVELLANTARNLGILIKQYFDDYFMGGAVAYLAAKELIDAAGDDDSVEITDEVKSIKKIKG